MAASPKDMPIELFSLENRTAFVTGAAGGLGKAIAAAYLRAGADVLLLDRRHAELEEAAHELSPLGRVHTQICDVTDADSVGQAVDFVLASGVQPAAATQGPDTE